MKKKHVVIPIFIPHRGCPFDCIYCNQKTISGQMDEMTEDRMKSIIETHLTSIKEGTSIEIGFYGGSFTGIDREEQIRFLKTANEYIDRGLVESVRLSTRPDYISPEILDYLKEYNVRTIELGVQSLDEEVLAKSCRGHSVNDVITSSRLINNYGFILGIQTMIGLPGDSRDKDIHSAEKIIELRPEIIRIYPALVIRGTYMEKLYASGDYKALELEEAIDICAELLELYEGNGIKVIRIGLQPTDTINENMDVVSGPFHPAFRQLVQSRLILNRVEQYIEKNQLADAEALTIYTYGGNISNVIGQKRENIDYLKRKYKYKRISVEEKAGIGLAIVGTSLKTNIF